MTAQRHTDDVVRAFLAEGLEELPDRAFDAVRGDIHGTRQRLVLGPWRTPVSGGLGRAVLAAAAALAISVAGYALVGPLPGPGGTPSPTPTGSPAASPTTPPIPYSVPLDPGTYRFTWSEAVGGGEVGPSVTVTVASTGWVTFRAFAVDKNYGSSDAEAGASFVIWKIEWVYEDPCFREGLGRNPRTPLPPAGVTGIDELLATLADQPGIEAGAPVDVTIDGYRGRLVELRVVADLSECPHGFFPWNDKYVQGTNERLRVYALDVDGFRLTFFARIPAITTAADLAELEAIIDSIEIEP